MRRILLHSQAFAAVPGDALPPRIGRRRIARHPTSIPARAQPGAMTFARAADRLAGPTAATRLRLEAKHCGDLRGSMRWLTRPAKLGRGRPQSVAAKDEAQPERNHLVYFQGMFGPMKLLRHEAPP